ncbi:MAG: hypothetical protein IV101_18205 [Dechloromonas sp.]|nr:hypothetical protein [Dechloromonas sp.]
MLRTTIVTSGLRSEFEYKNSDFDNDSSGSSNSHQTGVGHEQPVGLLAEMTATKMFAVIRQK